jgi:hypothetical protein
MRIAALTSVALLLGAGLAAAQDEAAAKMKMEMAATAARVPLEIPMKGAPFSAETIVESQQTLADGNRIVRKSTGRVYRDGEGRVRREEARQAVSRDVPYIPGAGMTVTIVDPVAGFSYALDPDTKTAWRTPTGTAAGIMQKLQAVEDKQRTEQEQLAAVKREAEARQREGGAAGGAPVSGDVMVRTRGGNVAMAYVPDGPIEHKVIEGVNVDGRKTTTTIPAGKIGNEQPLTITSEEWRSPELNVLVLTRHSDPRSGESSYRLTNIVRAEPDHSLFLVPPDYTVKDTGIRRPLEASRR